MAVALWGTKIGMSRVYQGEVATPVTVVQIDPMNVEVKTDVSTAIKH